MLTAFATIETAVEATQKGAFDYITKPFRQERILLTVDKAMQWQEMVRENLALRQALAEKEGFASLVGASPVMRDIFERIRQVAPTTGTVLITGPSGTGKELVARAVHQHSLRSQKKMVTVNCTAIPQEVLESELFGHVKGAFTGAWKEKKGLVEEAHEGIALSRRDRRPAPAPADQAAAAAAGRASTSPSAASSPRRPTCASSPPPTTT